MARLSPQRRLIHPPIPNYPTSKHNSDVNALNKRVNWVIDRDVHTPCHRTEWFSDSFGNGYIADRRLFGDDNVKYHDIYEFILDYNLSS